jgi:ectoine hydroxylase-related dioxygenase (phytanoyl-CoA dioxygenase family)
MGGFHSKFGGLWIDSLDQEWVNGKLGTIPAAALRQDIRTFIDNGYVILRGVVSSTKIDAYLEEYRASANTPESLQIAAPDGRQSFSQGKSLEPGSRVLDTGMLLPSGRELSFAPQISAFLEAIFEEKSLAFQTLHFEVGSTQDIHQDTAFVVVKQEPLKLIASWIALEDIESGSGELIYYPGGHRIKEYSYANGTSKHWYAERDGDKALQAHLRHLRDEAARLSLPLARFAPKKGDALLWHAELPHGGGEITIAGRSRRSLVTHYCPISLEPVYWDFIPADWRKKVEARGGNAFTSYYFPPTQFAAGRYVTA